MCERLIELIKNAQKEYACKIYEEARKQLYDKQNFKTTDILGNREEYISDYLRENGVVVLPCKLGSMVYVIRRKRKRLNGGFYNSICATKRNMQEAIKNDEAYAI